MSTPANTFWDATHTAELVKLAADPAKYSSADMAWRIGCTRNAVIGKARRMGIQLPDNVAGRPVNPNKPSKPRVRIRTKRVYGSPIYEALPTPPLMPVAHPSLAPPSVWKTLIDLDAADCRWPIGEDAPYLFCCAPSLECCPYCAAHSKKAYHRPNSPQRVYVRGQ